MSSENKSNREEIDLAIWVQQTGTSAKRALIFFDREDASCMRWSVNKKCRLDWVFSGGETPVCPFGVVQELRDNFW